jgi:hypothetical protein
MALVSTMYSAALLDVLLFSAALPETLPLSAAISGAIPAAVSAVISAGPLSAPALDPSVVADTSAPIRAAVSFLSTVLFGGLVIYQYGGRLGPAVTASTDSPLLSALYGVIAYGGGVFLFGYAFSQLFQVGVDTRLLVLVIGPLFALFVLVLGGAGFVVVGAWLTSVLGTRSLWTGLVALGGLTAVGWLLLPALLAFVVWLAVAAVGIGGPVRRWLHADAARVESS